jgi:hypothetical protein
LADELVGRMAILVAIRRFPGVGVADFRSLRFDSYVRLQHFVHPFTFVPLLQFLGMCGENFCNSWYSGFLSA